MDIRLEYFKTYWLNYQWFLLYEFQIEKESLFTKDDQEIILSILNSKILSKELYHSEMDNSKIELSKEGLKNNGRPYIFENLNIEDFIFLKDLEIFKKWIIDFRKNGWEDDKEDAQILISKAEKEIYERTQIKSGIWLLSKEQFENKPEKLTDINWIYAHFETFIEIDRKNRIIRTIDFGYD